MMCNNNVIFYYQINTGNPGKPVVPEVDLQRTGLYGLHILFKNKLFIHYKTYIHVLF